jgi:hypothetical protein
MLPPSRSDKLPLLMPVCLSLREHSRQRLNRSDILQYALTLEHLENVFYNQALAKFPRQQFLDAGFTSAYYDNLKYVAHDETEHVSLLTSALAAAGAKPVARCEYDFPYTDPKSFVALASAIEGLGTSAYLGAAPLIASKEYLGVAGSILVTEAIHTSLQRFNLGQIAPANAYGTALGIDPVYTLAAAFIKSCPSTNVALPVKAFPALTPKQGQPTAPGISFKFASPSPAPTGTFFVTFYSGLVVASMPATLDGDWISTNIPLTAMGQSYAILTNANITGTLTDSQVIAGPAILEVTPDAPTYETLP